MRHSTPCILLHAFGLVVLAGCAATPPPDPVITDAKRLQLARALVAQGDTASAANILNGSSQSERAANSIEMRRATTLLKFGEVDEALTLARTAMKNHPSDPDFGLEYARMAVRVGRPSLAGEAYKQILGTFPDNVDAMVGDGAIMAQAGDLPGAMARFRQALARKPDDVAARNNLALAMTLTGRSAEAVPMLEQLSRDQASSTLVRDNLARARAGNTAAVPASVPASVPGSVLDVPVVVAPVPETPSVQPRPVAAVPTPLAGPIGSGVPIPLASLDPSSFSAAAPATPAPAIPAPLPTPLGPSPAFDSGPPISAARRQGDIASTAVPARLPTILSSSDRAVTSLPLATSAPATAATDPAPAVEPAVPQGFPPDPVGAGFAAVPDGPGGLSVQLGSVGSREDAIALWGSLSARHPALLEGMDPRYEAASVRGRTYWRLRAGAFADRRAATDFCRRLRDAGAACIAQF